MNRGIFSPLNIYNWPFWVKVVALFTVAFLTLSLPSAWIIRQGTLESGRERAQDYLQLSGSQRVQLLRDYLDSTRAVLQSFSQNERNEQLLIGTARANDIEVGSAFSPEVTQQLFEEQLLNPANSLFIEVRLVDIDGRVLVVGSLVEDGPIARVGDDESESAAVLAIQTAIVGGSTQAFATSQSGSEMAIESIHAVQRRNGEVVGYLIGRINTDAFRALLSIPNAPYPANSFLVNPQSLILSAPTLSEDIIPPSISTGVARGRTNITGVDTYEVSQNEVIGYYTLLGEARLVYTSEIPVDSIDAVSLGFFSARAFVLVAVFVALMALLITAVVWLNQMIVPPLGRVRNAMQALGRGDFSPVMIDTDREDEIGDLASSFVIMRDQVQGMINELQARLTLRARDIDTTQEISRYTATERDLQKLLDRVVRLIVERFVNIYHAQVFLLDSEKQNAVLYASTGEPGRRLLERGHRLGVGSVSIVGQAVSQRRPTVARDTGSAEIFRPNDLLPLTRAELAIPLFFSDNVIGVLDVQSTERDVFTPDLISVLQTVANQVAVAIETARLYEESVRRLEQVEQFNRQSTRRVWQDYMRDQRVNMMEGAAGIFTGGEMSALRRQAWESGKPAVGSPTDRMTVPVAVPIRIGGQIIGVVEWELLQTDFNDEKIDLAQELANRLSISLDNARLFQESRRAAERERMVNNIAARLTAQTNVNEILQTAVREVGQALRTPQVSIRLHSGVPEVTVNPKSAQSNGNGNGNGNHAS